MRVLSYHLIICVSHVSVYTYPDRSLPFLDVRATKTTSAIVSSIFRKPTFTGLYTPWDSFSKTVYKVNLVRSLAHRIVRICSPTTVEGELTALHAFLAKNGYPRELLDRFVTTDQPTRREGPRLCPLTLRVPWLGSRTEKLVRRANDAVRLAYPAGEVRAVYRTNKALNLPKDRIPSQSQSLGVGQNSIVMSLKLCTFVVVNQCYVSRNHLL